MNLLFENELCVVTGAEFITDGGFTNR